MAKKGKGKQGQSRTKAHNQSLGNQGKHAKGSKGGRPKGK